MRDGEGGEGRVGLSYALSRSLRRYGFALASGLVGIAACSTRSEDVATQLAAQTSQPAEDCVRIAYGGREYWFCSGSADWASARATCESAGLHLVRVDGASENVFIARNTRRKSWLVRIPT